MRKEKKSSVLTFLNGSFIFSALDRFAAFFYRKAENGLFGGWMTAYDREDAALKKGLFAHLASRVTVTKRIKHTLAKSCEQSSILGFFDRFIRAFGAFSMRTYGAGFVAFAVVSMLLYSLSPEVDIFSALCWSDPLISIIALVAGIPMLFSNKHLYQAVDESKSISFLIYSVIGARTGALKTNAPGKGKAWAAIIVGTVLGLISDRIHTTYVVAAVAILIGLYTVLAIPEFGVVTALFSLCFLPTMALVAIVFYTSLCYMLKLWRGKRTFRFELMDGTVAVFFVFMAGGGIASVAGGGSILPAMVYLCFMLGYFLTVNLMRSAAWIKRCIYAIATSSFIVSAYGIYQNYFGEQLTKWQDTEMFDDISGRVISTFENPNVLGEYLIMILPILLAMLIIAKSVPGKFSAFLMLGISGVCLIFTWSRGAWLGFLFACFIFFLFYTRKTMILCLCGLCALPFLPTVLPENIINRITSIGNLADSSTSYRVSIWEASVKLLRDHLFSGIGIGENAFTKVYPTYALSGIENAPHSHNLFLQTAIEIGLPGLIALIAVLFLLIQSSLAFYKQCKNGKMQSEKLLSLAAISGIMGVALQGMTDYIWYNYRVYLMFWLMIGLAAAIRRVAIETTGITSLSE